MTKVVIPGNEYKVAEALLAAGQYEEAIAAFEALEDYRDSAERILECEEAILAEAYAEAEELFATENFDEAVVAFESLGDYKDSKIKITEVKEAKEEKTNAVAYDRAVQLFSDKDFENAYKAFLELGEYKDAAKQAENVWNSDWDLRCVPFAEAVGANTLNAQVVTYNMKLLLYGPFCDGKNEVSAPDTIPQTVILNVLLNHKWHSEDPPFSCFLLCDFQTIAVTIPNNITEPQFQYITNPQT